MPPKFPAARSFLACLFVRRLAALAASSSLALFLLARPAFAADLVLLQAAPVK